MCEALIMKLTRTGGNELKDFRLRNDTKLLFRSDPSDDLVKLTAGKRVLFVYCGGSVKRNGCYADIRNAVRQGGRTLYEAGHSSRERASIEAGIRMAVEHQIELVIGAGGASVMDCAKLIAFGARRSKPDFLRCGHLGHPQCAKSGPTADEPSGRSECQRE